MSHRGASELAVDKGTAHRLIEMAFEPFDETGVGPTVDQIHRRVVREGMQLPFFDTQQFFARNVGAISSNLPITLSISQLVQIPKAASFLEDFVKLVRLSAKRCVGSSDDYPKMTSEDVRATLHFSDLTSKKVMAILPWEPFITQGSSSNQDHWEYVIGRDIHFFADIKSIHEYLSVVEKLRNPAPATQTKQEPSPPEEPPEPFSNSY
jgi:hypothetical protein